MRASCQLISLCSLLLENWLSVSQLSIQAIVVGAHMNDAPWHATTAWGERSLLVMHMERLVWLAGWMDRDDLT
jgi:hypothetical protein